jgi:hypothetical protein
MRRLLVVSTMSALVLGAAACGGSKTVPITAISNAPAKTADAGSAKLEVTVAQVTTKGGTTTTAATPAAPTKVTGSVDFKAATGRFAIGAASLGLPAGSGPVQAILVGQVFYFNGLAGLSLPGKPWIKIDLSKLFGAPSALELAVLERDTELVADGRTAVGMAVGVPKRQSPLLREKDELDDLMDSLEAM